MIDRIDLGYTTDDALAHEVERTLHNYSFAWEGEHEIVTDMGEALVREQPSHSWPGMAMLFAFDPVRLDERLDQIIEEAEARGNRFLWIMGPSTRPPALERAFTARGFHRSAVWDGLVLRDISAPIEGNLDMVIEPLTRDTIADYVGLFGPNLARGFVRDRTEAVERHLSMDAPPVHIFLAWLEGVCAGYATLRIEPSGVAYLRNAFTRPSFRGRGVYLGLVAHRLALARQARCTGAVIQAITTTSAPILRKRGFERVCGLIAYAH